MESGTDTQVPPAPLTGGRRATRAQLENLQAAWDVSKRVSKEDWLDWYNRLCSELLKASPSPALRACWKVAQRHSQLAKDLFNASFVSCWTELDAAQQDELIRALQQVGNFNKLNSIPFRRILFKSTLELLSPRLWWFKICRRYPRRCST